MPLHALQIHKKFGVIKSLLALQYLDDTRKTHGSERVASIFMLAVFSMQQKSCGSERNKNVKNTY